MFDSDFITNPYRTYSQLRTAAPLHWTDKFRNGAWLVPRYADALAGLHDSRLSSQRSHAALAYTEAEIAFTTLLERASGLRLLDEIPAWRSNLSFRGLNRLPLALLLQ
jgi:cytochrome P450